MPASAIELALFPLDVVLFPGAALPLHIFESRYRHMIADCVREDKPFGVVLVRPESEHLHELTYPIGTMAIISDLNELEDGRYDLMAVGMMRFRIVSQHRLKPYLSGIVEFFEDDSEPENMLQAAMMQARSLFGSYLNLVIDASDELDVEKGLPDDPEALSHFIAYFLDVHNEQKQRYLELTSTYERLQEEIRILRREVPFMRQILSSKLPQDRARLN